MSVCVYMLMRLFISFPTYCLVVSLYIIWRPQTKNSFIVFEMSASQYPVLKVPNLHKTCSLWSYQGLCLLSRSPPKRKAVLYPLSEDRSRGLRGKFSYCLSLEFKKRLLAGKTSVTQLISNYEGIMVASDQFPINALWLTRTTGFIPESNHLFTCTTECLSV